MSEPQLAELVRAPTANLSALHQRAAVTGPERDACHRTAQLDQRGKTRVTVERNRGPQLTEQIGSPTLHSVASEQGTTVAEPGANLNRGLSQRNSGKALSDGVEPGQLPELIAAPTPDVACVIEGAAVVAASGELHNRSGQIDRHRIRGTGTEWAPAGAQLTER